MEHENVVKLLKDKRVRSIWDERSEKWLFSVVDIVELLTGSYRPRKYWATLKKKLLEEGSEVTQNIKRLSMLSKEGVYCKTDAMDVEGVLRLIQSIISPEAETFKLWLANVGARNIGSLN